MIKREKRVRSRQIDPVATANDNDSEWFRLAELSINQADQQSQIALDCALAFKLRAIGSASEQYSSGSTYFLKADEKPTCLLELLAQKIFLCHTKDLVYNKSTSGAEWWTQVIDPRDDIGFHWDRDYGLEEEEGINRYPLYATVTYISSLGAPTIILKKKGLATSDSKEIVGPIEEAVLVLPTSSNTSSDRSNIPLTSSSTSNRSSTSSRSSFRHVRFDGCLLHGAPAVEGEGEVEGEGGDDEEEEEEEDDPTLLDAATLLSTKRITFLVNIWLDHRPSQAIRCPSSLRRLLAKDDRRKEGREGTAAADIQVLLHTDQQQTDRLYDVKPSDKRTSVSSFSFLTDGLRYDLHLPWTPAVSALLSSLSSASCPTDALLCRYARSAERGREGTNKRRRQEEEGTGEGEEAIAVAASSSCCQIVLSSQQPSPEASDDEEDEEEDEDDSEESEEEEEGDDDEGDEPEAKGR